jgi:hypothetical protein
LVSCLPADKSKLAISREGGASLNSVPMGMDHQGFGACTSFDFAIKGTNPHLVMADLSDNFST